MVSTLTKKILNVAPITERTSAQLKLLVRAINEALNGIKALHQPLSQWDPVLVELVKCRLDETTKESRKTHYQNEGRSGICRNERIRGRKSWSVSRDGSGPRRSTASQGPYSEPT